MIIKLEYELENSQNIGFIKINIIAIKVIH